MVGTVVTLVVAFPLPLHVYGAGFNARAFMLSSMKPEALIESELTESVVGAFFEVYNVLGPGFLKHVYLSALERELRSVGHHVRRQVPVPIRYKGETLCTQRLDMIVDGKLIIEAKSSTHLPPTAIRQLNGYLKATSIEIGLLLHFGPEAKFYRQLLTNDRKAGRIESGVQSSAAFMTTGRTD